MLSQIMVPLDGSELAEQALPYAQRLVTAMGGTMHLTVVVELPAPVRAQGVAAPVNVYEPIIVHHRAEAAAYLEQVRQRVQPTVGRPVTVAVLDGYPASALIDHARVTGIDVIVMTNHGHRGLSRWVMGSVAERVAHAGAVPVLIVPADGSGAVQAQI